MKILWTRKELKTSAKKSLKRNFVSYFAVCFIMAFIAGQYGGSTQFIASYELENVTDLRIDGSTKRDAVEAVKNGTLTYNQSSEFYNINDVDAIKKWEHTYDEFGPMALNSKEITFFHSGNETSNWNIIDNIASKLSKKNRVVSTFVEINIEPKIKPLIFPEKHKYKNKTNDQVISQGFDIITQEYSPFFQIGNAVMAFFTNLSPWEIFLICLTTLFSVLLAIFVQDMLIIGEKRFFLESRTYHKTSIGRLGFLIKNKKFKTLKTIVIMHIFRALWFLTIIGGFIKVYEYYMIPFILAENPDIDTKQAFSLSKQMMKGNKFKTFVLNLSFLNWEAPVFLTAMLIARLYLGDNFLFIQSIIISMSIGVTRILFLNCYKTAVDTELYIRLRRNAIKENYKYSESLNDKFIDLDLLSEQINDKYETIEI